MTEWQPISTARAGERVLTKIDDEHGERNVQPMTRRGSLWFIHDGQPNEMYVYYTPTHWRQLPS
jgi:hypothetical protein